MLEIYRRKVPARTDLLDDESTRPEAMEIIHSLITRIEVGPPEQDRGPCTVTLVGALASVLAFVSEQENGGRATARADHSGRSGQNDGRVRSTKQNGRPLRDGRPVDLRTASSGTFLLVGRQDLALTELVANLRRSLAGGSAYAVGNVTTDTQQTYLAARPAADLLISRLPNKRTNCSHLDHWLVWAMRFLQRSIAVEGDCAAAASG